MISELLLKTQESLLQDKQEHGNYVLPYKTRAEPEQSRGPHEQISQFLGKVHTQKSS